MEQRKIARYGYIPDLPDHRDFLYSPNPAQKLPSLVDLRPNMPPVYDQGELGSCTANAIAAAFEYQLMKLSLKRFTPSRLLIYYNERLLEGTIHQDAGAQIRDGIKVVSAYGAVDEKKWPYVISKFDVSPPKKVITEEHESKALTYTRLNNTNISQLKACLAGGAPFVFGFSVYEGFESDQVAQTGFVSMPGKNEQLIGGHAVLAAGYDDSKQSFIVRNSWGENWGLSGYFYLPYAYVTNTSLADDFWNITKVN